MKTNVVLFLCGHGQFCLQLIESAKMIGASADNMFAFPLMPEMSPDDYSANLVEEFEKHQNENILCLADLFGGTPCMTLISLSQKYRFELLTGMNLPMLLEISNRENKDFQQTIQDGKEAGTMGIRNVMEELRRTNHG